MAEDHQTHNARALSDVGAAVLVTDADARQTLIDETLRLMADNKAREEMSKRIKEMAITDSDSRIADEVCRLLNIK